MVGFFDTKSFRVKTDPYDLFDGTPLRVVERRFWIGTGGRTYPWKEIER